MIVIMIILHVVFILTRIMPIMMLHFMMLGDTFEMRFEFPVTLLTRQGTDLHVDIAPSHLRLLIAMPHGFEVLFDLHRQLVPKLLVRHLTATELKLNAHLVSLSQEVFGMDDFDVVIVRIDPNTEFHFLHFATLLVLVSFLLVLLLDVLVFAVVDDLAHWRVCIRRDLHEIQPTLFGNTDRLVGRHDAELMSVLLHHTHFRRADAFIHPSLIGVTSIARTPLTRTIERWS